MELSDMMKRIIACVVALMVCASLVLPAAAARFTPSVVNKRAPKVTYLPGAVDGTGTPAWAEILVDGKTTAYVYEDCLVVTSVADAPTSNEIPGTARSILLDIYKKLLSGEMTLPYEKLGLNPQKMAIRDLFDASFVCGNNSNYATDHPEELEPQGTSIRITFDVGVDADTNIYTMTYKNNEWVPIVETVNNGDGTVTCTFEKLCPVVFCVEVEEEPSEPPKSGDPAGENLIMWIVIAAASLVAVVALVVVYRVKTSKK